MATAYRPEIDGLRAVAVVPVMLFHAGVPGIPGGFLGVDVFFVISGYLITSLIVAALAEGRFSFWEFYARRARRLLPALAAMLLICLPVAWATMLPKAFGAFGISMGATAIFLSNVHFWQLTGYFDGNNALEPLLHTWSLSIEEQYYLIFPVILLLLWRFLPRAAMVAIVMVLAFASLAFSQWGWSTHPDVNYFFTPSRFWELLGGSLAAMLPRGSIASRERTDRGGKVPDLLAFAGLGMIIASMLLFTERTPHPALPTLVPVLGTVLVLLGARTGAPGARLLTLRPLVGIGLISYSLYLWHQPVLAFTRIIYPDLTGPGTIALQLALTFLLGGLSWRFVEQPFRLGNPGRTSPGLIGRPAEPRKRLGPRGFVLASWLVLAGLLVAGLLADAGRETARRYHFADAASRALLDFAKDGNGAVDRYYMHGICFFDGIMPPDTADRCLPLDAPSGGTVIWGDSHAAALAYGLRENLPDFGQITTSGCAPILSQAPLFPEKCQRNNSDALGLLQAHPPETLLLHSNWIHREGQIPFFGASLVELSRNLPKTRIVIIGGMPQWQPSLPERIFDAGLTLEAGLRIETDTGNIRDADDQLIEEITRAGLAGTTTFIRLTDLLCQGQNCEVGFGETGVTEPLVWDYGHLTATGATALARRLSFNPQQ